MRKVLIRIVACCAVLFPSVVFAAETSTIEQYNQQLDRARGTLDEIGKSLADPTLSDSGLRNLRDKIDPLPRDLQEVIDKLTPRLSALQARLDQLGAPSAEQKPAPEVVKPKAPAPPAKSQKPQSGKPGAGAPAGKGSGDQSPETKSADGKPTPAPDQSTTPADANSAAANVNAELVEQRKLYDDTDAILKRARALMLEAQQTIVTIGARQRALFTQTLFLRTSSVFAPSLWHAALRDFPGVMSSARTFLSDRMANVESRLTGGRYAQFIGVVLLILIAIPPAFLLARRVLARNGETEPTKETKVLGAAWTALAIGVIPITAIGAFALAVDEFDLVDATLEPLVNAVFSSLLRVAAIYAVARGALAPRHPQWRLFALDDGAAVIIVRLVTTIAIVLSVTYILEQLEESVQAALPVVIVTRGVGVLIAALLLGVATLAIWRRRADDDDGVRLTSTSTVESTDRLRILGLSRNRRHPRSQRSGLRHFREYRNCARRVVSCGRRGALSYRQASANRRRVGACA